MSTQKSQKKQHQGDLGDLHCQPAGVLGSAHLYQQDPGAVLDSWEGFQHHQFLLVCCDSPPSCRVSCGPRNSRACCTSPRKRVCSDLDQQGSVMLMGENVRNCVLLYLDRDKPAWERNGERKCGSCAWLSQSPWGSDLGLIYTETTRKMNLN